MLLRRRVRCSDVRSLLLPPGVARDELCALCRCVSTRVDALLALTFVDSVRKMTQFESNMSCFSPTRRPVRNNGVAALHSTSVLLLGCQSTSKSLLAQRIKLLSTESTRHAAAASKKQQQQLPDAASQSDVNLSVQSTNGIELTVLTCKQQRIASAEDDNEATVAIAVDRTMTLREVGGSIRSTWPRYYNTAEMILFTLDSTNSAQLSESMYELILLLNETQLSHCPFVVCCTKWNEGMTVREIDDKIKLQALIAYFGTRRLPNAPLRLIFCNALTGEGCESLLALLMEFDSDLQRKRNNNQQQR